MRARWALEIKEIYKKLYEKSKILVSDEHRAHTGGGYMTLAVHGFSLANGCANDILHTPACFGQEPPPWDGLGSYSGRSTLEFRINVGPTLIYFGHFSHAYAVIWVPTLIIFQVLC